MADRNSIIDKIKALLAKTTANGATEAEMLAALDKAAAMQDAYDISDEELQVAKDKRRCSTKMRPTFRTRIRSNGD